MAEETGPAEAMSEFDRLIGVLVEPQAAFADIAARPVRWWVPLVLLAVLGLAFSFAFTQRVGWERFLRQQIDRQAQRNARLAEMPAEQREQIIEQQVRFAPIETYVVGVFYGAVIALVVAGALLFVFNVLVGTEVTFRQAYALCCYSLLPYAISGVLVLGVLFLQEPEQFNLENPLAANVAAFLDPDTTPRWVASVAASVHLFNLWILVLLATGFSAAARRLSWGRAFSWVVGTWVVWLVVKGGVTWIFS